MIFFAVLVFAVMMPGCDELPHRTRYQLITLPDGKVFRLDNATGDIHYVTPDGMHRLDPDTPKLKQGEFYQMENGKFLEYVGSGQFKQSDYAVRKIK